MQLVAGGFCAEAESEAESRAVKLPRSAASGWWGMTVPETLSQGAKAVTRHYRIV